MSRSDTVPARNKTPYVSAPDETPSAAYAMVRTRLGVQS